MVFILFVDYLIYSLIIVYNAKKRHKNEQTALMSFLQYGELVYIRTDCILIYKYPSSYMTYNFYYIL